MAKQMAFHVDSSACSGCKGCVVACKSKNQLPVGVNWRRVYEYGSGGWMPDPEDPRFLTPSHMVAYSISVSCMHCQDPICTDICPTGAMTKGEDGIVRIDGDKCVGCRYCEWACPYGAPQFNEAAGVMTKCDFCQDLLAKGEDPYCVGACPMRALDYGELEELQAKYGDLNAVEPLPVANLTKPSIVITPHRHAQPSGKGIGSIITNAEEG